MKASKKQAFWAEVAAIIGVIGTGAILATLIWTIRSVKASERSADAAVSAVNTSSEIGRAQVRAYVSFVEASATMKRIDDRVEGLFLVPFFDIQVKNFGNSPAIGFKFYTTAAYLGVSDISLRNGGAKGHIWGDQNIPASGLVGFKEFPIANAKLVGEDIMNFEKGSVTLIVTFHTVFTDVFGAKIYETTSLLVGFLREDRFGAVQAQPYAGTAEATAGTLSALS